MIAAVVPIHNEEGCLEYVLRTLEASKVDLIIPVLNGCTDNSYKAVKTALERNALGPKKITPLEFPNSLGIDVPRPVGTKKALDLGASAVLIIDGDMQGPILTQINDLISGVTTGGLDMALTDCYQNNWNVSALAQKVLLFRAYLNKEIGLYDSLGVASPSHGPHALSARFLRISSIFEMAIPPMSLTMAQKSGLKVGIAASIPHCLLGSGQRSLTHSDKIAETIIGDCLEAIEAYRGRRITRSFCGRKYLGYHQDRDFKALAAVLNH